MQAGLRQKPSHSNENSHCTAWVARRNASQHVPCGYSGNWKLTIRLRAASEGHLTSRERALRIADLVSLGLIF